MFPRLRVMSCPDGIRRLNMKSVRMIADLKGYAAYKDSGLADNDAAIEPHSQS